MREDRGTALPGNVVRIDEERIKDHLGRIVRGTVEETLNALLDAEADRLCNAKRYERTEARRDTRAGSYQRKLHTRAGEVTLQGAEAAPADLRDGDHRALPPARELGRGGPDRDVSGGGVGAPGRGHHRGAVGHAGQPRHGEPAEPEDLRPDRGLAEPADRRRAPLRLPGRHRAQAQLGWRGPQRLAAGGDRRLGRGLPRDPRHLRGRQGGQGRAGPGSSATSSSAASPASS